jgi:UDP-N-acetylmuramoylalanine--D-glutamate ligase
VHIVLYGENRFQLLDAAVKEGFVAFSLCANLEQAVHLASFVAQKGQCVLLSPASSSFDLFANYEERGDAFVKLVEGIHEKQPS